LIRYFCSRNVKGGGTGKKKGSGSLYNVAGFDAGGADQDPFHLTVPNGSHPLQVGVEAALVHIMGVADVAADHGLFSTHFTHL
jgi:hypothetical protein